MRELVAFANSEQGQLYGGVCQVWGVDPGAAFTDDVLAFNLRSLLMPKAEEPAADKGADETNVDAMWMRAGDENRRWLEQAR